MTTFLLASPFSDVWHEQKKLVNRKLISRSTANLVMWTRKWLMPFLGLISSPFHPTPTPTCKANPPAPQTLSNPATYNPLPVQLTTRHLPPSPQPLSTHPRPPSINVTTLPPLADSSSPMRLRA